MYNWKAEGNKTLEDSKGDKFGDIDQDKLKRFSVLNDSEEIASVDLKTGAINILGKEEVKAGANEDRILIWIKRNIAQPGHPLKTSYVLGYYVGKDKVCYKFSEEGLVEKQ